MRMRMQMGIPVGRVGPKKTMIPEEGALPPRIPAEWATTVTEFRAVTASGCLRLRYSRNHRLPAELAHPPLPSGLCRCKLRNNIQIIRKLIELN